MRDDDPFRRHLDDYAAVGRDGAVPPMVHEIYRRGRRHQRLQTVTWGVVGVLTLIATFLAGMVVRDQTDPTAAGAVATTTTPPTTTSNPLLAGPSTTDPFGTTTVDPFATTTTSFSYTTTTFSYTTTTFSYTTTTTSGAATYAPPLESGKHSVIITSISGRSVKFDKVDFFRGDAAAREARNDGRSVTNGYYIRNENPALRTFGASDSIKVQATNRTMDKSGSPGALSSVTLNQLAGKMPDSSTLFKITLSGGKITAITEYNLG
jgi:hypothetical protein